MLVILCRKSILFYTLYLQSWNKNVKYNLCLFYVLYKHNLKLKTFYCYSKHYSKYVCINTVITKCLIICFTSIQFYNKYFIQFWTLLSLHHIVKSYVRWSLISRRLSVRICIYFHCSIFTLLLLAVNPPMNQLITTRVMQQTRQLLQLTQTMRREEWLTIKQCL